MSNNLESVLGLPQNTDCFSDGVVRKAYPITMQDFPEFIGSLQNISKKNFWLNFIHEESQNALKIFIELTFKDDDYNVISRNINAGNWQDIVSKVLIMNGIESITDKSNKPEGKM